jgi:hypothetical protein
MVDVHIDAAQLPHDDTDREKDRDEKPHEI